MKRAFLFVLGTLVFLNGAFLYMISNFNLGVILTILLGAFLLACAVFYKRIKKITRKGIFKYIKYLVLVLVLFEICLVGFIAFYGQNDNVDYTEDAVIVLGAGVRGERITIPLKLRLDAAIKYHKKNPDALIVVTGGKGYQEDVTEAYAMEKYLVSMGVNPKVIVKEERATSTNENMRFSKELLDGLLDDGYSAVVVTNNFHIYRGVQIARLEGFDNVYHLHASLQWYNYLPCYLRESLAILKMWVFG